MEFVSLKIHSPGEWRLVAGDGKPFVVVGSDYETTLLVDVADGGVYSEDEDRVRTFVNSSLNKLLQCMEAVRKRIDFEQDDVDEAERRRAMKAIYKEFSAIDPEARKTGRWWDFLLEQLADGIL